MPRRAYALLLAFCLAAAACGSGDQGDAQGWDPGLDAGAKHNAEPSAPDRVPTQRDAASIQDAQRAHDAYVPAPCPEGEGASWAERSWEQARGGPGRTSSSQVCGPLKVREAWRYTFEADPHTTFSGVGVYLVASSAQGDVYLWPAHRLGPTQGELRALDPCGRLRWQWPFPAAREEHERASLLVRETGEVVWIGGEDLVVLDTQGRERLTQRLDAPLQFNADLAEYEDTLYWIDQDDALNAWREGELLWRKALEDESSYVGGLALADNIAYVFSARSLRIYRVDVRTGRALVPLSVDYSMHPWQAHRFALSTGDHGQIVSGDILITTVLDFHLRHHTAFTFDTKTSSPLLGLSDEGFSSAVRGFGRIALDGPSNEIIVRSGRGGVRRVDARTGVVREARVDEDAGGGMLTRSAVLDARGAYYFGSYRGAERGASLLVQRGGEAPELLATFDDEIDEVWVKAMTERGMILELIEERDDDSRDVTIVQLEP